MLLGNGHLLNKLPMQFIGGILDNTNWLSSFNAQGKGTFESTTSVPNGYAMSAFSPPIKAGGMSSFEVVTFSDEANALCVFEDIAISQSYTMGAYASCFVSDTIALLESLNISASAYISSNDIITVDMSAIAGALMGTSLDDTISVSMSFSAGLLMGMGMNETIPITLDCSIGAYYGGSFSDSISITMNTPLIFGSALATMDEVVTISMNTSALGDGWMRADGSETSGVLTAKEVWEYYQRTLTSSGSLTTDEHNKLMSVATKGDVWAAAFV